MAHIDEKSNHLACAVNRLERSYLSGQQQHLQKSEELRLVLGTLGNALGQRSIDNEQQCRTSALETTEKLATRLEEVKEMSLTQYGEFKQLLQRIEQNTKCETAPYLLHGTQKDGNTTMGTAVASTQTLNTTSIDEKSKDAMSLAVRRLSEIVVAKTKDSHSNDAQEVIEELRAVVVLMLEKDIADPGTVLFSRNSERLHSKEHQFWQTPLLVNGNDRSKHLPKFQPLLTDTPDQEMWDDRVVVGTPTALDPQASTYHNQNIHELDEYYIKVSYEIWAPANAKSSRNIDTELSAPMYDVMTGQLQLLPRRQRNQSAKCWRCQSPNRHSMLTWCSCVHWRILFSRRRTVFDHSEVFQLVFSGYVNGLKRLICCSLGSIHDGNISGRSLLDCKLNVSTGTS